MKTGSMLPPAFSSPPSSAISGAPCRFCRIVADALRVGNCPGTSGSRNVCFGAVNLLGWTTAFGRKRQFGLPAPMEPAAGFREKDEGDCCWYQKENHERDD